MQLEKQNVADEAVAEEVAEPLPPKRLTTKQMAEAFKMIDGALALFQEQDPNYSPLHLPQSLELPSMPSAISNGIMRRRKFLSNFPVRFS